MGFLIHIVLALGLLALAESGVRAPFESPLTVLLLCGVPHALAAVDRRLFLRGHFKVAGVAYVALGWSPLAAFAVAIQLCGWTRSVERWFGAEPTILGWPHVMVLVALAPLVAYTLLAIDARARISDARTADISRARRFHARLFLSGLAPFAVFVVLAWLTGLDATVRANIEHVGLCSAVFAAVMLALSVWLLPWLLRNTWDTSPMPRGAARELFETFSSAVGFRCRDLLVWNTGQQMANAAVVGVGASQRVVLFSDALLGQLPPRELLAVFAHEIGHVARHHVLGFVGWALALFVWLDLALTWLAPETEWVVWGAFAVALAAWYVGFGFLSRRAELDADLYSIELTGDLTAMTHALELVGSPHTRGIGSWRHFSTARRISFLHRATAQPAIARRLRRSLSIAGWTGLALAASALLFELRELVRGWPEDRVIVALALGDYTAARERLGALDEPDAELERRVALGTQVAGGETDGLLRAALEALPAGEREKAADYLVLAELRGRKGLGDALGLLESGAPNAEVFAELDRALRTGSR